MRIIVAVKGGPGSGNFGHAGRPGLVGGSATDGITTSEVVWGGTKILGGKVTVIGPEGAAEKVAAVLSKVPGWHADALTPDILHTYLRDQIGMSEEGITALMGDVEKELTVEFISDPEEFVVLAPGRTVGGSAHYNKLVVREEYLDDPEALEHYVLHELGHQIDDLTMRLPTGSTNYRYVTSSESSTFRSAIKDVRTDLEHKLNYMGASSPAYRQASDDWKKLTWAIPGHKISGASPDRAHSEMFAEAYYMHASGRGDQLPTRVDGYISKFFRNSPPKGTVLSGTL